MTTVETTSSTILDGFGDASTEYTTPMIASEDYTNPEMVFNISSSTTEYSVQSDIEIDDYYSLFGAFNVMEIVMTLLEMSVWILAAIKLPRWRNNYRNQMLMQMSVARFFKRVVFSFKFLQEHHHLSNWEHINETLNSAQTYIDFVIVILVFFFVKHMYDSLIIVLVKIRQQSLYKVSICAWLLPLPISAVWTVIVVCKALDARTIYLLICCIFRWPLIIMSTVVYITTLHKVMSEQIRKFARSLTVITFFMCLTINFYLFSKDVIVLWCYHSLATQLVSYTSGFIMNFLILTFYIILVSLDYNHGNRTHKKFNSIPNCSFADNIISKV